jgi:hypothetical protein
MRPTLRGAGVMLTMLGLAACGGASGSPVHAGTTARTGTPSAPGGGSASATPGTACGGGDYFTPLACYVDVEAMGDRVLIEDEASLAALLRSTPPEANRGECDVAGAAHAVDFTRERLFYAVLPTAGQRLLGAPVRCDASGAVTVTVDVGPECGGAERGPGYLLVRVPRDGSIQLVDTAPPNCPAYGGDPPA